MLLQHQKVKHKLPPQEAKRISKETHLTKVGSKQQGQLIQCPFPNCISKVRRIDKHLQSVHGLKPEDGEYKKFIDIFLALLLCNTQGPKVKGHLSLNFLTIAA